MIKNKKQLTQSKEQLLRVKNLAEKYNDATTITDKAQYGSLECRIIDLEDEISEYENLLKNGINGLIFNLSNVEKAIVSLRIASKLTQKELAEKLGVAEQQIQRYENQDYLKASFERIIQIISVLTDKLNLSFVEYKKNNIVIFKNLILKKEENDALLLIQKRGAILQVNNANRAN